MSKSLCYHDQSKSLLTCYQVANSNASGSISQAIKATTVTFPPWRITRLRVPGSASACSAVGSQVNVELLHKGSLGMRLVKSCSLGHPEMAAPFFNHGESKPIGQMFSSELDKTYIVLVDLYSLYLNLSLFPRLSLTDA